MATRYWFVANNGSANWNTSNWYPQSGGGAGASTLASTDDGVLDSNSGRGTITVSGAVTCNSLDSTTFLGTLAGVSQISIANQTTRGPSASTPLLAWGTGMTLSHSGTVSFGGTAGLGGWIFCNGQTFKGPVNFNNTAVGCTFTFKDTFRTLSTSLVTVTSGDIIANEANVEIGTFSYGTGTKSFTCENLYLIGTGALAAGTNAANSTSAITNIIVNNGSVTAKTLTFGTAFGSTNVELGGTGAGSLTMAPGTTFKPYVTVTNTGLNTVLSFTTGAITDLIFAVGTTAVWTNAITQTLTMWGNLTFTPLQPNPTRTPALLFNQSVVSEITMAGKVLVTGNITVNNPAHTVVFLDEFNCPLISLTASDSSTITFKDNFTCSSISNGLTSFLFVGKNLNCGTLALSGTGSLFIGDNNAGGRFNSQVTVTTITFTSSSATLYMYAGTLNCGNITIGTGGTFQCIADTIGYTVTVNCTGAVTCSGGGTLTIASSTNTPAIFNCTGSFSTTNGNVYIIKSEAYFTTFSVSGVNSQLYLDILGMLYLSGTGTAFSMAATSSMVASTNSKIEFTNATNTAITFGGGTFGYYEVVFNRGASTATNTISGSNTFINFRDLGTAAHTISFTGGTTQSIGHFDVHGSPGNVITLTRSSTTATYVSKSPRGIVTCDYVTVTNLFTDDLNTWYSGPNSTVTNSANWVSGGDVRQQSALGVG
jgi:hypothetical protein